MKFAVTLIERRRLFRILSSVSCKKLQVDCVVLEIKVIGGTFSVTYVQNVATD